MAFTSYGSSNILSGLVGRGDGPLSTCYMALSTTTPNEDGSNFTEPASSTGYARVLIGQSTDSSTQKMTDPQNAHTENSEIIFFPEATSSWGTITHFGLYDAATNGRLIVFGQLSTPVAVSTNFVPLFRVSNFSINLT